MDPGRAPGEVLTAHRLGECLGAQQVVAQETQVAELEAQREERRLEYRDG